MINYVLDRIGIKQLYNHQAEAILKVRSGKDIVIVTSTVSGKSLSYMIPVFEMADPNSTALYIAPPNALVNDQLESFIEFRDEMEMDAVIRRYIGTMNEDEKREVRYGNSQIILRNPEMIHLGFLPWYRIWKIILDVTLRAIESCPCSDGCLSCIQSPKCGNHNNPLDKTRSINNPP